MVSFRRTRFGSSERKTHPEKGNGQVYRPNSRPNTLALVSHRLRMMMHKHAMSAPQVPSQPCSPARLRRKDAPRG